MDLILTQIPPLPSNLPFWDKESNLPRWLVRRYEGMESDIADFYLSYYFHKEWDGSYDPQTLAETNAEARMEALVQTGRVMSAFEEATIIQLHEANRTGWLTYLGDGIQEIHGLRELTEIAYSREYQKNPDGGPRYENENLLKFLNALEEMMLKEKGAKPTREKVVVAMRKIIARPDVRTKTRESGKTLNRMIATDAPDDQRLALATEILEDIANPAVSSDELRVKNRQRLGKMGDHITDPIEGDLYVLGGKEVIVVFSPSSAYTRAIESTLKGLVQVFSPRDPANLLTQISNMLLTRGRYETYHVRGERLYPTVNGVRLPKQGYLDELIIAELANKRKLVCGLALYQDVYLPIYEIEKGVPVEIFEHVSQMFGFKLTDEEEELEGEELDAVYRSHFSRTEAAIRSYYRIPKDAEDMLPKHLVSLSLVWEPDLVTSPLSIGLYIAKEMR